MHEKEELRKQAKEIRNSLNMKNISEEIVQNIKNLDIYQKAKHIMIFYPLKHEVDLLNLLSDNKNFYLPVVNEKNLMVCPYKVGDKLAISAFKTKEPITKPIDANILDIIFIPALMVDNKFNRLGYGGGFYDRFLSNVNKKIVKIVTIPSNLIVKKLPTEGFDAKIDIVISESIVKK